MKKKIKIELASNDKVEQYDRQIKSILKILGHPESLVTDESLVWDFLNVFDPKEGDRQLAKLSKKVGFRVESGDFLWEVAKKMEKANDN